MRRIMLVNILFGLWLMLAPFILSLINKSVRGVLWEDLLLGFGIAAFALCRMLSRRAEEIAITDSNRDGARIADAAQPYSVRVLQTARGCLEQYRHRRGGIPFGGVSGLEGWRPPGRQRNRRRIIGSPHPGSTNCVGRLHHRRAKTRLACSERFEIRS